MLGFTRVSWRQDVMVAGKLSVPLRELYGRCRDRLDLYLNVSDQYVCL